MTDYYVNIDKLKIEISKENRWHLKCLAILTFHTAMQATRENIRNFKWRIEDSASELNLSIGFISESIKLAKALNKDSSLQCVTRDEALRRLREGEKV